jgi:hypothetical protein
MPRSHGVIKVTVWEVGSDFRQLPLDGQWAYEMLISQPQINNLGLLPYNPEKWWRFADDLTAVRLHQALTVLEQAAMTVTDPDTGELLVRTFIKHDRIWKQPKLVTNARKLIREVESERIRAYLLDRHPWLTDETWKQDRIERHESGVKQIRRPTTEPLSTPVETRNGKGLTEGVTEPLTEGEHEGVTEGLPEGVSEGVSPPRARAQDGLPLPLPQDPTPRTGSSVNSTRAVAAPDRTALAQNLQNITPDLRGIT